MVVCGEAGYSMRERLTSASEEEVALNRLTALNCRTATANTAQV